MHGSQGYVLGAGLSRLLGCKVGLARVLGKGGLVSRDFGTVADAGGRCNAEEGEDLEGGRAASGGGGCAGGSALLRSVPSPSHWIGIRVPRRRRYRGVVEKCRGLEAHAEVMVVVI